jgi:hypothetical protein
MEQTHAHFEKTALHNSVNRTNQTWPFHEKFSSYLGADDLTYHVNIHNVLNTQYLGDMFFGTPKSQSARVVFDTGSTWLVVTSSLCGDSCSVHAYDISAS